MICDELVDCVVRCLLGVVLYDECLRGDCLPPVVVVVLGACYLLGAVVCAES